ncbi:polysaccharide biosynthesis protein [Agaricicola taiwanensis]|uniref:Polysaccharide biosynthesis protein n=1 Tax=Agaricicola taiwanensis TaxID=591372 RepID=A0A8J2YKA1_9RHOB|nr:hypothetical protein [Agaricicola taiwanensis]GGE48785.1 polysaccharide biosynthesis protein [Agaricicola taiwanensis]
MNRFRQGGGALVLRQAGMLTAAAVLSQLIMLAATPLLAQFYSPDDFGRLSLLIAFMTIGGGASAFFHLVIQLPRSGRMAAAAFRLSVYLVPVGALLTTSIYWLTGAAGHRVLPAVPFAIELMIVMIAIAGAANFTILNSALWRAGRPREVALARLNFSLLASGAQLFLGAIGFAASGLQLGRILGQGATNALMIRRLPAFCRLSELLKPRRHELLVVARRYRDAPIQIPRDLLQRGGTTLPPALMLGAYGPTAAGFYFLAERLVERPGILLGDTLTRLPMKLFAERVRMNRPMLRSALLYTLVSFCAVALALIALAFGGPWVLDAFFDPAWGGVAAYAAPLALGAGIRVGTLPLAALVPILRIQHQTVWVDLIFFSRIFVFPVGATLGWEPIVAVWALVGATVVYIFVILAMVVAAAARYERHIPLMKPSWK